MGFGRGLEGALRPSLYMDGPRRPGQGTLHCASASRDGGRRNARHAAFPAPGRPIRGCAAARHAISLLSARHIDGRWSLDQKALGRAAATGARGSTRHGDEGERIRRRTKGPARFPHWRYAFSSTVSRTQRGIRLGTARLHRSERRRLREPFSPIRTKKGTESPTPDSARFTV